MKLPNTKTEAIKHLHEHLFKKKVSVYKRMGQPHNSTRDIAADERIADSDAYYFFGLCVFAGFVEKRNKPRNTHNIIFTPKGERLYRCLLEIDSIFKEP